MSTLRPATHGLQKFTRYMIQSSRCGVALTRWKTHRRACISQNVTVKVCRIKKLSLTRANSTKWKNSLQIRREEAASRSADMTFIWARINTSTHSLRIESQLLLFLVVGGLTAETSPIVDSILSKWTQLTKILPINASLRTAVRALQRTFQTCLIIERLQRLKTRSSTTP